MFWRVAKAVLILPVNVCGTVPALILWGSHGTAHGWSWPAAVTPGIMLGIVLAAIGLTLAAATVRLFVQVGEGTPAPWDPPRNLVVRGPYRHVRNPMISSVLFMLAAEALVVQSWPLAAWGAVFFAVNCIYFPLSEEKDLEARFGEDYRTYKANVPRWLPRLTPWSPGGEG